MKVLNSNEFKETIKSGYALIDFYADWCGPCKMIAPVFEELSQEHGDKLAFAKVDVDAENAIAAEYGVMSIPTLILFKDGEVVKKAVGFQSKPMLESLINEVK